MTQPNIGNTFYGEQHRDAIHIAIAPVMATETLRPGQRVCFARPGDTEKVRALRDEEEAIGIIDPFLRYDLSKGECCFMFLMPNTITSLRHQWTHPAFGDANDANASRQWIENFAADLDQTYSRLMTAAGTWLEDGQYTYDNSEKYKDVARERWPIFWHHYEIVTGTKVMDKQETFFTCSC